jgi:hypothetical protein
VGDEFLSESHRGRSLTAKIQFELLQILRYNGFLNESPAHSHEGGRICPYMSVQDRGGGSTRVPWPMRDQRLNLRDLEILRAAGFNVCTDRHGRESLHEVPHYERQELRAFLRAVRPDNACLKLAEYPTLFDRTAPIARTPWGILLPKRDNIRNAHLAFAGDTTLSFYKGRFRGLPGRPLLGSRPVSFSTVAPLLAGLTAGLRRPPASIERTPRCVTWCG